MLCICISMLITACTHEFLRDENFVDPNLGFSDLLCASSVFRLFYKFQRF